MILNITEFSKSFLSVHLGPKKMLWSVSEWAIALVQGCSQETDCFWKHIATFFFIIDHVYFTELKVKLYHWKYIDLFFKRHHPSDDHFREHINFKYFLKNVFYC